MKRLSVVLIFVLLSACGGNDSSKLAKDVCDCYSKANAMDPADPKRATAQDDCVKKQGEAWNKIKDNPKKSEELNKLIGECSRELINKSLGK